MSIGSRIKARREACGLSVIDLAERLGKARSTRYRYESDEVPDMPITVLEPLARALNTTPGYLMGWTEDPTDRESEDPAKASPGRGERFEGDVNQLRAYLRANARRPRQGAEEAPEDDELWTLREEQRQDPDRKALFKLSKYGRPEDIRQVNAIIDALRATNPEFYDGDDPC